MEKLLHVAALANDTALSLGAQIACCTAAESEKKEFNVDGGEFSLFRTLFDRSVSVTVFKDQKKGRIALNRFDDDAVREAVKTCVASLADSQPDPDWEIASGVGRRDFVSGCPDPDTEKLFFRTKELLETVRQRYPLILMEQMIVSHSRRRSVYLSTTGNEYRSLSGCYDVSLMFSAHDGDRSTSFYGTGARAADLDTPFIDLALMDREIADVQNQLDAAPTEGKFTGRVILAPNCLISTVIGPVMENFASDDTLIDGTSLWKNSLGDAVASEKLSVRLAPRDKLIVCGENYTSEGYIAQDFDFIKKGKLSAFLCSQYGANKTKNKRAPNDSSSVIVERGDTPLEKMIASVDRGLLVARFSGGNPSANGEFSGVAKNGFLIENGRIARAVSETMISGNLADMLKNIASVSSDYMTDGYSAAPYIAFDGVTVSGK